MKLLRFAFCLFLLACLCAIPALAVTGEELLTSADVHLTFDGEIKDVNGKYNIISEGDTPLVEGRFGQAANFQAAENSLIVEDLRFETKSFTVAAWVKQNAVEGDPVLFGNKDWNSGANPGWLLSARTNDWKYNANVTDGTRTDCEYPYGSAPAVSSTAEWNHVILTVDREAEMYTLYVNGQKYGKSVDFSGKGHADVSYDDDFMEYPFSIGEDGTGIYNMTQVFDVDMDEFVLLFRAINDEEAAALYTYAPEGYEAAEIAESPLLAPLEYTADGEAVRQKADLYISFDDGVKDDMGHYTLTPSGETKTVEGKSGSAGNFNGTNNLLVDGFKFGTDSFTLSLWLNEHEVVTDPTILSNKNWDSGKNPGVAFAVEAEKWIMNVNTAEGTRADRKITVPEVSAICEDQKDVWTFITFVVDRDAKTITGYFNGRQIGDPVDFSENGQETDYEDNENGYMLYIGDDGRGEYFTVYPDAVLNVDLDELAIFRTALTADEVAALYSSYEAPVEETPAVERTLTLPKTEFTVGEEIPVTATGSGTDWVGVYLKDEVPGGPASICWYYVAQDRDSGTAVDIRTQDCQRMDFDPMLPAGDYTVFLLADDGYDVVTSLDFTVVGEETVIEPAEEQGTEDQGVDEKLDAKAEAPNTFDFGVIAAVASLVSLGGFALTKKKH